MAVIDQDQLYIDTILYLPNVVLSQSEAQVRNTNANVVATQIPEDDDQYYSEALCKCLKANALMECGLAEGEGSGSRKREKAGQVEVENFQSGKNAWEKYLDKLPNMCPYLPGGGFTGLSATIGIYINPGDPVVVNDCCPTDTDLHL